MSQPFGKIGLGVGTAEDALAELMRMSEDPGPVVASDGEGRFWTPRRVYGVDTVRRHVSSLPRHPPARDLRSPGRQVGRVRTVVDGRTIVSDEHSLEEAERLAASLARSPLVESVTVI